MDRFFVKLRLVGAVSVSVSGKCFLMLHVLLWTLSIMIASSRKMLLDKVISFGFC